MATETKDERAAVRMSNRQRQTIDAAATVTGVTLTEFMVQAAVERAHDVLADQRVFYVPEDRWDEVMRMAEPAPEPNPGLVNLFARPNVLAGNDANQ